VGSADNDLVIDGQGSNLMVGGFGFRRAGDRPAEVLTDASIAADREANDAPWASVSGPADGVFAAAAATELLDAVFGSTDIEFAVAPGDES
jgi:hypothetical protein